MEPTKFEQSHPCQTINNYGCEIYFLRHAESEANIGNIRHIDSPLSVEGINQAKKVSGHFDIVFCSPLRRTKETLHYSSITYDSLIIEYNIREHVQNENSTLLLENFQVESMDNFWTRSKEFTKYLEAVCKGLSTRNSKQVYKILIVSHGFFFNAWYRKGCFPAPDNAKLFRIL